jgi:hypothetical protein
VGAANKSIAQQKHQVLYGRLTKQRKELHDRTLELVAKRKEALSSRHWTMAAIIADKSPPDYLTDKEELELKESLARTGRGDDLERFVSVNADWLSIERPRNRGVRVGLRARQDVRHDRLLAKVAQRVDDADVMLKDQHARKPKLAVTLPGSSA